MKTLYDVLGVDSKSDVEEIKKAFRRLARSLHPDVNKAEDADVKFKEVQDAYDILSDPEVRAEYDNRLAAGNHEFNELAFKDIFEMFFANKYTPKESINGEHIHVSVSITAEQLLRGAAITTTLSKTRVCTDCTGFGFKHSKDNCAECKGKGGHTINKRTPFGKIETFQKCVVCEGTGKRTSIPCSTCASKGVIPHKEEFEFQLNPMSLFGDTMIFRSKGFAGINGGKAGDLHILIEQSEYDKMEVAYETDLREQKVIPLRDFLEGKEYQIIFPDGTNETIKLNNENSSLVFPEKGLFDKRGNRGSYNLNLVVGLPTLTNKQRTTIINALEAE